MKDYEIPEAIKGKTIKYASFGGKYATIEFTDGTVLEMEAEPPGRGAWGEYEGESIYVSLKESSDGRTGTDSGEIG